MPARSRPRPTMRISCSIQRRFSFWIDGPKKSLVPVVTNAPIRKTRKSWLMSETLTDDENQEDSASVEPGNLAMQYIDRQQATILTVDDEPEVLADLAATLTP